VLFTLLAASFTFTNLAKSKTDAFVDSHSSFNVAESGLNKRASEFIKKLKAYSGVTEVSAATSTQALNDCFGVVIPANASESASVGNYLGCINYSFNSSNSISKAGNGGNVSLSDDNDKNTYVAYTLISKNQPQNISIPSTDDYAGLNAMEYKYVLDSTAKKPVNSVVTLPDYTTDEQAAMNRAKNNQQLEINDLNLLASATDKQTLAAKATAAATADKSSNNIKLSLTFTNRVISLFQFAIFYNGDLEFNSTSPMTVQGWVHSNANIYAQPAGEAAPAAVSTTTFLSKVSAVGSIYNRVDAWADGIGRTGITKVLLTGSDCSVATNCQNISDYVAGTTSPATDPLGTTEISTFQGKLQTGIAKLKTPPHGFTRKRNYSTNKIGEYYAKADMRLDFVPDRDVTAKTATPWTRDTKIIPFNFTATTTTGTGTCTSTAPLAGSDPDANYIDPDREGLNTLKCNKLTKGQLQSLRQPVLVLTKQNQTAALVTQENTTLNQPAVVPITGLSTVNNINNDDTKKNKILRALQVALVSTPDPISVDQLNIAFNVMDTTDPALNAFKAEFSRLLDVIFPVTNAMTATSDVPNRDDKLRLLSIPPSQIAAIQGSRFLPAPIQRVETRTVQDGTNNPRRSGFYDGREQRWISVLQTNIASLSVWNRDGLYVSANNETLTSAYVASTGNRDLAFNDATTASYSTSGLAFDRSTADSTKPVGSFQYLGLGSIDQTEGGLILHASVNDDLNGSGSIDTTNDITRDTTNPITETNIVDGVTTITTTDYFRKYPGVTAIKKSPFAFAFTGGDYLPNSLLLSSDQGVYIQGNFNNNNNRGIDGTSTIIPPTGPNTSSLARLSASVIADTITVLSNDCVSSTVSSTFGVPVGQLNCGIQNGANLVGPNSPMVVNAAFLSNTDASVGNYHTVGETLPALTARIYSGGVNNYIRLLEDWNNGGTPIALNYTGSLISLGVPLEYSGQYRPGGISASAIGVTPVVIASYYNIPFRNFNYDPNFSNVDKMPPLTPKASYIQQKNFGHTY
jgi:hypothetical protein